MGTTQRLFRDFLEAAPDAMIVADERGFVVMANTHAEEMFGYGSMAMNGLSIENLMPGRFRENHVDQRAGYIEKPRRRPMGHSLDLWAQRADGSEFPVEISLSPLVTPFGTIVVAAIRDITDSHRVREELRKANEAKTRFLAAASHDLRQPLQASVLFARALDELADGDERSEISRKLKESIELTRQLLDRLLDVSRIELGTIEVEPMRVNLDILFARLRDQYEPRAREQGLRLRVRETRRRVHTDPLLLEQILQNLLTNALRYTESGEILLGTRPRGRRVAIQVHDTGIGMTPEQLEHVWEEFYRVRKGTADKGLGLGLAIVRQLAELLGHEVGVRSNPGRGSCFEILVDTTPGTSS